MGPQPVFSKGDGDKTREELLIELEALRGNYKRLKDVVERYERVVNKKDLYRSQYDLEAERDRIGTLHDQLREMQKEVDLQNEELEVEREEIRANLAELNSHGDAALARETQLDDEARRRVAEAVESERKRLYDVLEALPAMVCLTTPDYHIPFANRAFCERFGEANGRHCYEYCYGKADGPCEFCESLTPLKTGKPHHWETITLDGGVVEVHDYPFTDADGTPMVLEMSLDITKFRRADEALKVAKAQADLYVDLMGHDINNMNQVSLGFLELAHNIIDMNGKLGEADVGLLDRAMDSLKNSSQLIDNVRKIQRERTGLYESEVIDVGRVVEDAVGPFRDTPGRDVQVTVDAQDHCQVRANALLKDVFVNLVGNAVKHSRGDLTVNVRVGQCTVDGKDYCRVAVEDDGPGIPDTLKGTLFDRLNLTSTRVKGKGFGLCLIKMLVDDYHGQFWVEDRVIGDYTKGARFVVMLPAVEK